MGEWRGKGGDEMKYVALVPWRGMMYALLEDGTLLKISLDHNGSIETVRRETLLRDIRHDG